MKEILHLLPILALSIIMNIEAGLYYNIGTKQMHFDKKLLLSGIIKAGIIASIFIGTAYCFDSIELSITEATPAIIMKSAITLYIGKTLISLSKILGIKIDKL